MPDSTSDRVTYPNPAFSIADDGPEYVTYSFTNEAADRSDVFLGAFGTSFPDHVVGLFPPGLNIVTVTTSEDATCQFTYFRLGG